MSFYEISTNLTRFNQYNPMAQKSFSDELELFRKYLRSESNEDAKTPLLHPLFQKLFWEKFRIESDVHGADVYVAGQPKI